MELFARRPAPRYDDQGDQHVSQLILRERQTSPAPDYSEERLQTKIPHRGGALEDKVREGIR
jgi:hypothetical protein